MTVNHDVTGSSPVGGAIKQEVFCFLLFILFFEIDIFDFKSRSFYMKTKQITFAGLAIALAIVVSTIIKLPSLPNGGSITLFSMLIISMIGYCYGPTTGFIASITYGVLQFILEPYFVHPLQVLLDYPLAFGALGISGFFSKKKNGLIYGYLFGILGRLFFHEVSGLIFYTTYVGNFHDNMIAISAVLIYNASYVLTEGLITLIPVSYTHLTLPTKLEV